MTTTEYDFDAEHTWSNEEQLKRHEADEGRVPEETRIAVYVRDSWRCRKCGEMDASKLTVHHVRFRSQGGNHDPENLVTVCWNCHRLIHDKIIKVFRRVGEWFFADERDWRNR